MCYTLYLGSINTLPPIAAPNWSKLDYSADDWFLNVPRLVVVELNEENSNVRCQFVEPSIVQALSYQGCGCGFNTCADNTPEELRTPHGDQAEIVSQESRAALVDFIEQHGVTTLYGCWSGDEPLSCELELEVSISQLRGKSYVLRERTRMSIKHR
jgi:hypothetical protein